MCLYEWTACARWPSEGKSDWWKCYWRLTCLYFGIASSLCCRCMQVPPSPGRGIDPLTGGWGGPPWWSMGSCPCFSCPGEKERSFSWVHPAEALSTSMRHGIIQGLAQIEPLFYYKSLSMPFYNITMSHSSTSYDILGEMFKLLSILCETFMYPANHTLAGVTSAGPCILGPGIIRLRDFKLIYYVLEHHWKLFIGAWHDYHSALLKANQLEGNI